jgi:uncharacterized protein (TIGR01777 family)
MGAAAPGAATVGTDAAAGGSKFCSRNAVAFDVFSESKGAAGALAQPAAANATVRRAHELVESRMGSSYRMSPSVESKARSGPGNSSTRDPSPQGHERPVERSELAAPRAPLDTSRMVERIVVTGGTGYLGRALVPRLVARGLEVSVLSRGSTLPGELASVAGVRGVTWDAVTEGDWVKELAGARAVIHLAGEQAVGKRYTESYKRRIVESRVKTGELLVRAIGQVDAPPAVVLSASGVDYYASDAEGDDTPVDESAPPGTGFLSEVCVAWEGAVAGAAVHGARVAFMRCGAVLGRGGGALATMVLPFKLFVGGSLGSGRQYFSWVHLEDALRAFERALDDASLTGPINVVAPNPVRWDDLARTLGRALHRPSFIPVPSFALRALFADGAGPLLTGRRAVPAKLERAGFVFRYPTVEEALKEAL